MQQGVQMDARCNIQQWWKLLINNVASVCTALPTLMGPRTLITHGLQRLMGCILPTMHCRSQHCWELLLPFAHHCQHARNNSQHCCANNVESCCARLHAALNFIRAFFYPSSVDLFGKLLCPCKHNHRNCNLLECTFPQANTELPVLYSLDLFGCRGATV